jgi:hypothetical protein
MLRKLSLGSGLALTAFSLGVLPALAYTGTPGTSASTSSSSVSGGSSVTLTAHFNGGAGQTVNFTSTGGTQGAVRSNSVFAMATALAAGPCTPSFSPNPGTTDASGNVSTTVSIPSTCSGTLTLTATSGAQAVSTTLTVNGLPAASTNSPLNYPLLWIAVFILGLGLVAASVFGLGRRQPVPARS